MTNGCRHDNVKDGGNGESICLDCASKVDTATWHKLHAPPKPKTSWVQRKAVELQRRLSLTEVVTDKVWIGVRETVEKCADVAASCGNLSAALARIRALLEPSEEGDGES